MKQKIEAVVQQKLEITDKDLEKGLYRRQEGIREQVKEEIRKKAMGENRPDRAEAVNIKTKSLLAAQPAGRYSRKVAVVFNH